MLTNGKGRRDASTQTKNSTRGAQLRVRTAPLPTVPTLVAAVTPLLSLLNGLCYHLYWRYRFLSTPVDANATSAALLSATVADVPPAMYGLCSAVYFQLLVGLYVVRLALLATVGPDTPLGLRMKTRHLLCWFCVAVFPFLTCHLTLYAGGYTAAVLEGEGTDDTETPRAQPPVPPHFGLFVVTIACDAITFALAVSYLWCDVVVDALEANVRAAARSSLRREELPSSSPSSSLRGRQNQAVASLPAADSLAGGCTNSRKSHDSRSSSGDG